MCFHESERLHNVRVTHCANPSNTEGLINVRKVYHHKPSGLVHVNMRRAVLTRWKQYPNMKATDVQHGWHE
jgi:hypothetical protein